MQIGNVKVGSEHPIALQTMTTTDTRNVQGTVDQVRHSMHLQSFAWLVLTLKESCSVVLCQHIKYICWFAHKEVAVAGWSPWLLAGIAGSSGPTAFQLGILTDITLANIIHGCQLASMPGI